MFIYSQSTHFLLDDQKKFISMKPVKGLNLNYWSISGLESERPETTCWWIEVKKVTSCKLTKYNFVTTLPGLLGFVLFIDGRGRKRIYPSTDLRAKCFSRGRK